jgi:hypothetical protein
MIRTGGGMDAPGGAHKGMATVRRPELLNSTMMREVAGRGKKFGRVL